MRTSMCHLASDGSIGYHDYAIQSFNVNNFETHFQTFTADPFSSYLSVADVDFARDGDFPTDMVKKVFAPPEDRGKLIDPERIGPWLVEIREGTGRDLRSRLASIAIHRQLASTDLLPNKILALAKRWGFLGLRHYWRPLSEEESETRIETEFYDPEPTRSFEPVQDWYEIALFIKVLLTLGKISEAESSREIEVEAGLIDNILRTCIDKYWPKGLAHYRPDIERPEYHGQFPELQTDYLVRFARLWKIGRSQITSTSEFRDRCKSVFQAFVNSGLAQHCTPEIQFHKKRELQLVSRSLIGAVFVSLATECMGHSQFPQQCAGCNTWFFAEHGRQKHCSDSCKTKAYRRRQISKRGDITNG